MIEMDIKIGDTIYHPIVDVNVGFAIEEVSVTKLIGAHGNPFGYSWLIWTYGNVTAIKERDTARQGAPRAFVKRNCYLTMEECIEFLEMRRQEMISLQKDKREQVLAEVIEAQKFLKETKRESLEISRQSNKNVAMLSKLDIRQDLERRGLL